MDHSAKPLRQDSGQPREAQRRQGDINLRRMSSASSPGVLGQPRKAI